MFISNHLHGIHLKHLIPYLILGGWGNGIFQSDYLDRPVFHPFSITSEMHSAVL